MSQTTFKKDDSAKKDESTPLTETPLKGALPAADQKPTRWNSTGRLFTALRRFLPTVLVMSLLAGLGYAGHHTGWKVPRFSELTGTVKTEKSDWCEEHNVPESECVECDPELYPKPKDYGWCKVHGVHQCPLHHPDVAQLKKIPQISQADLDRATRALELKPRKENHFACTMYQRRVQFASHKAVQKAGIDVELVECAPMVEFVAATGEIRYDETRIARLSSKAAGTVWRVEKQIGATIKRGEILALVDAVEVGRAKAELLAALVQWDFTKVTFDRVEPLARKGSVAGSRALEAKTAVREARVRVLRARQSLINLGLPVSVKSLQGLSEDQLAQRMQFLGLPQHTTSRLDPTTTTSNLLPLASPLNGVIVARDVVAGEVVDISKVLFTVADTRRMWLILNIPLESAKYIGIGQTVRFQPDGETETVKGTINWISTAVDKQTRTVEVRVDLSNPNGRLRDETFGLGRIVLRDEKEAIVVPNEAVQWDGSCHVVLVRDKNYFNEGSPKLFHTRSVRPGAKNDKFTEIIAGVLPGEVVATKGSDVLRAQLLKSNLGAG